MPSARPQCTVYSQTSVKGGMQAGFSGLPAHNLDSAVDHAHRGVIRIVVRVARDELLAGRADLLHLAHQPEFPAGDLETARAARARDLDGAQNLEACGADPVAVGLDHAKEPLVDERETVVRPDRLADNDVGTRHASSLLLRL